MSLYIMVSQNNILTEFLLIRIIFFTRLAGSIETLRLVPSATFSVENHRVNTIIEDNLFQKQHRYEYDELKQTPICRFQACTSLFTKRYANDRVTKRKVPWQNVSRSQKATLFFTAVDWGRCHFQGHMGYGNWHVPTITI